ncbi:MAG TPA: UvrD-helicase domain-containing protein, partial [Steroidobacteraceae bacterium]
MSDTDDIARERATDPRLSVLLQAPAGSGKTTVLTRRFLRLLAEVDEPEQILAITFTRKAAAEMRERVLKALRGPIPDDAPEAEKLRAAVAAVTARSWERGWNLLDNPGRLRIQTIDSFNFWLASQLPLAARVGGTLAVADRPWELYQRAARATLIEGERDPELAADIHLLFERVDNNFMRTQRLLADMLQKRGHWLRFVVQQSPEALRKRIADSLVDIVGDRLREIVPTFPSALRRECERITQIGPLGEKAEHLEHWQRLAGLLLTKEGT